MVACKTPELLEEAMLYSGLFHFVPHSSFAFSCNAVKLCRMARYSGVSHPFFAQ